MKPRTVDKYAVLQEECRLLKLECDKLHDKLGQQGYRLDAAERNAAKWEARFDKLLAACKAVNQ